LAKKGHKLILASGNTVNQFLQKQRAHKQLISARDAGSNQCAAPLSKKTKNNKISHKFQKQSLELLNRKK
jgi:hypothetical protein